jgi:glutaredoxin-like protein NrdH
MKQYDKGVRMKITEVKGTDKGKVMLYALSTCIWCRKTKQLLGDLGVAYSYVDVDLADEGEKEEVRTIVKKWKGTVAYPLIVIDDKECIPTFDEVKIRERLG